MVNSDIYIMVPVNGNIKDSIISNLQKNEQIVKFVNALKETSDYECDNKVSDSLERKNYGTIKISYYKNDNYEEKDIEWINSDILYTYNENTKLGIIQFIITNCDKEDSQIGDIISSNHLEIRINDNTYKLNAFLKKLSLEQCGKIRTINCNHIKNKDRTMKYTLIAETANSEHSPYHINENYFDTIGVSDYSKYDFYELYAAEKTVVYLLKDFSNNYEDNIENETLLIYICEIAVFQNAAVSRINSQIVDELMKNNSKISPKASLALQREYGRTILFWNNNIFNYNAAQDLSNDIVKAFKTKELVDEYKRNSKYLEQISNLDSGISQQMQSTILSIIGFIISINQLYDIIKNIKNILEGKEWQLSVVGSSVALIVIFIIVLRNYIINNKKR